MDKWNCIDVVEKLGDMDNKLYYSINNSDNWYDISDSIWQCSEDLLVTYDKYNELFMNAPEKYQNEWLYNIAYSNYGIERLFIYTLLNQYYKGVPIITEQNYSSREDGIRYLEEEFNLTMQYLPTTDKLALNMFMARFYLSIKRYEEAYKTSKIVIDQMNYSADTIFTLGNYKIQYEDILLVCAEAALNLGRTTEAIQNINRIVENYNLPAYLPEGANNEDIRNKIIDIYKNGVAGKYHPNGGMMKYAEYSRFLNDKHGAIPFPKWLLDKEPNLAQNTGWQ